MKETIIITGALSVTGKRLIEMMALPDRLLIGTDKAGAVWEKFNPDIPCDGFLALTDPATDLREFHPEVWDPYCQADGIILLAAIGIVGSLTSEQVNNVNCHSQVELVKMLFRNNPGKKCRVVHANSSWGFNPKLPLPHSGYKIVADGKYQAEQALRFLARQEQEAGFLGHQLNVTVATVVEKTIASILLRRAMKDGYADFVNTLPEKREVTVEEFCRGIIAAYESPRGDQTIFVPSEMLEPEPSQP